MVWWSALLGAMGSAGGQHPWESESASGGMSSQQDPAAVERNAKLQANTQLIEAMSSKLNPALNNMNTLGITMGKKKTHKGIDKTNKMFRNLQNAAKSSGIMGSLMGVMKSFFIWLEPFLPIIELFGAWIESFFGPIIVELIDEFDDLYDAMSDLIPVMVAAGSAVVTFYGWMKDWRAAFQDGLQAFADWMEDMSTLWNDWLDTIVIDFITSAADSDEAFAGLNMTMGDLDSTIFDLDNSALTLDADFLDLQLTMDSLKMPSFGGGGDDDDDDDDGNPWYDPIGIYSSSGSQPIIMGNMSNTSNMSETNDLLRTVITLLKRQRAI